MPLKEITKTQARIELTDDLLDKFLKIQNKLGIKHNTEVLRYLINYYYKNEIEAPPRPEEDSLG